MTCKNCEAASANPAWGGYSFQCPQCCARLIASGHPDQSQMLVLLDAIERYRQHPPREEIRALVKSLLASRTSPQPSAQVSLL